jgi:hypothetical protein
VKRYTVTLRQRVVEEANVRIEAEDEASARDQALSLEQEVGLNWCAEVFEHEAWVHSVQQD